ncbi:MFS transporter [Bathymodiolus septemdierum thioautotrophic gill symbiont]|uniref:MFS transporter, NNP family, nitrate/nitrite transporter n=1 Tax=endosymbiont of Bathymodiolus septemdierum str. Myojin knoll TaxID=1303921 RepID=A0A0P0UT07_9GAMM|nr:MFS transporter [Bathymodiolus septemdierum thioautotrophic gill symbiont]BAS68036.1 MFS transporter, NNP family, nitrate/nitrite transporter [endosymbiont of Bathymodiolus septemdierum str. Myojin knoll]
MEDKLTLFSFKGKYKILHLTWFAFFMSFVVWLSLGPMMPFIREALSLTQQQAKILLILNVAITIPSRIVVGMLVDKFGPKIMFTVILVLGGLISIAFAWMQTYEQLALLRFLSGFIGAGFVVGIRLISEWFPAKQTGVAQGVYGGWGNFGSAGAAMTLPFIASSFGGIDGWRYAITAASLVAIVYGIFYYFNVSNTPKGSTYFKPKKSGAMEVSSYADLALYITMNVPLYLALSLMTWKLADVKMIPSIVEFGIFAVLIVLFFLQALKAWQINIVYLKLGVPKQHRYKFKQVALLNWAYFVTFGTELAVVSILAMFYVDWFGLDKITAALLAGVYPFLNLFARPGGGYLSDKFGRKIILMVTFSGISLSFLTLGTVEQEWSIYSVIALTIIGGIFSKAGSGAIFAMVPLIQRRLTGQIAGMTGAFGNVGAVMFLTVNSLVDYDQFFMLIGIMSGVVLMLIVVFLEEPKGHMTEVLDDGTVEVIKLN